MNKDQQITILHKEKHFVAIIKPAGLLSEASSKKDIGLVDFLESLLGCEVFPVHRLDREASGVMIYATTPIGASKLGNIVLSKNDFEKKYLIIVHGKPEKNEGSFEDLLFKDSKKNKSFVVTRERKGVKKASLEYHVLESKEIENKLFSLVSVKLITGRTHQIRVQFSSRNMPVLGDNKYGSDKKTQMCLFSQSIVFTNPFSKKRQLFSALPNGEYWDLFKIEGEKNE